MNDPFGDMLARIRNAQMANKKEVVCIYSRLHERVAGVLKDEGYIRAFRVEEDGNKRTLVVDLKYEEGRGVIRKLDRVSTPGRRVYTNVKSMPRFYNGLGILVVSTPKGVMPDYKARSENVGGEILCQVF